jgi:hypothetical protein
MARPVKWEKLPASPVPIRISYAIDDEGIEATSSHAAIKSDCRNHLAGREFLERMILIMISSSCLMRLLTWCCLLLNIAQSQH